MEYCSQCEAQITSADYEAGECTQCGGKIMVKVLKEEGNPLSQKVNQLEEFLRNNNISIFAHNELFITIDGDTFDVRDMDGGGGGRELPRTLSSERLVLERRYDERENCR